MTTSWQPNLGRSLNDFTERARRSVNADPGEIIAAAPTVAEATLNFAKTIESPWVLRFQNRRAETRSQRHLWDHLILIRPTIVSVHRLGVMNRVGKFVEGHPMTDFFFEPLLGEPQTDCLLTIDGNPYYVRSPLGAQLIEVLHDHGFESGLTTDI